MKNKFIKMCVAVVLTVATVTTVANATGFSDITSTYSWAKEAIEDVSDRKIITGYTDGTFRPSGNVTVAELLVMLARMCNADSSTQKLIYSDYKSYITGLFGTKLSWAHESFATCIGTGIITKTELSALYSNGSLETAAAKELMSVFLVRAMQLETVASKLETYNLTFADASQITALRKPYIFVLSNVGIVKGNTENKFEPKSSVTRAVTATMLSRAIAYMEENDITVDFGDYSERTWENGTITEINTTNSTEIMITVSTEMNTKNAVLVPMSATYYLNGKASTYSALVLKRFVNICRSSDGTVLSVYVTSSPETISGTIISATKTAVKIKTADKTEYAFAVADFSEVSNPSSYGDANLIETSATLYSEVKCKVNSQNQVLYLEFVKSVSDFSGTISAIKTSGTNKVISFVSLKGLTYTFTIPSTIPVYEDDIQSTLTTASVGYYTTLKIAKSDNTLAGVYIDKDYTVATGAIRTVSTTSGYVSIRNISTLKSITYDFASGAVCYYKDNQVSISKLSTSSYATALISDEEVVELYSYPSDNEIEGTIESISFGTTMKMVIYTKEGYSLEFTIELDDLPNVERDDDDSTIDKLREGDEVTAELELGKLESIEATSKEAERDGVITRITQTSEGNILTVKEDDDEEYAYVVPENADITSGGTGITFSSLKVGYSISFGLRADTDIISMIEVSDALVASDFVRGNVIFINYDSCYILVDSTDTKGNSVTYTVYYDEEDTKFMKASSGAATELGYIGVSDKIIAIGSYSGSKFNATIIIEL